MDLSKVFFLATLQHIAAMSVAVDYLKPVDLQHVDFGFL